MNKGRFQKGHNFDWLPTRTIVCPVCGKTFTTKNPRKKYCNNPCTKSKERYLIEKRYFIITSIRQTYVNLIEENPYKAKLFKEQMEQEEGPEFTKMVLGNILHNKLDEKEVRQTYKRMKRYENVIDYSKDKAPKYVCPKCGKPYYSKEHYRRHYEECKGNP